MSEQCSKVIFSEKSKFCIEFGDRGALVWRAKDEHYNPACLKRSVKFPTSVMVWDCVSTRGMGNIVFLKSTVTADVYMKSLCFIQRGFVWHLYGDEDMIFQQHLTPAHSCAQKGQDIATGAEHSSARLVSQQSRPKHYWRSVEHYEETHEM